MKIAITGGIAEGKSTVLGYLRDLGFSVASADEVAREVMASEAVQSRLQSILRLASPFGAPELRSLISSSTEARRAVNRVVHPAILASLRESTAQFIEIPLLIETCLQGEFERVWVVTCGHEEQLARLQNRMGSLEIAEAMMATQLTSRAKCAFADEIVRTNQPELRVKEVVEAAVAREFGE